MHIEMLGNMLGLTVVLLLFFLGINILLKEHGEEIGVLLVTGILFSTWGLFFATGYVNTKYQILIVPIAIIVVGLFVLSAVHKGKKKTQEMLQQNSGENETKTVNTAVVDAESLANEREHSDARHSPNGKRNRRSIKIAKITAYGMLFVWFFMFVLMISNPRGVQRINNYGCGGGSKWTDIVLFLPFALFFLLALSVSFAYIFYLLQAGRETKDSGKKVLVSLGCFLIVGIIFLLTTMVIGKATGYMAGYGNVYSGALNPNTELKTTKIYKTIFATSQATTRGCQISSVA